MTTERCHDPECELRMYAHVVGSQCITVERQLATASRLLLFAREYIATNGKPDIPSVTRRAVSIFMIESIPFAAAAFELPREGARDGTQE